MLEFKRKRLEQLCDAKIVTLYKDILQTPDGGEVVYDLIHHKSGGGAGILLVDEEECTYLVRQYRNSIDAVDLEIPAGGYNYPGEAGEVCAIREAEEETGWIPQKIYHIANLVSSIGTFDERTDTYIGLQLKKGNRHLDPTEFIDIVRLPMEEAREMIYQGKIVDCKTITAILAYYDMKTRGIFE